MKRQLVHRKPRIFRVFGPLAAGAVLAASSGCSNVGTGDAAVYRRAESQRVEYLEREVERMRVDLSQAEDAMIYLESGMRGEHTRADAVSKVAGARVAVESACARAPWRGGAIGWVGPRRRGGCVDRPSHRWEEHHRGREPPP